MNIIEKKISELKAYENNPKIHTDRQIELIAKSIEMTKGLRQPIVIDSDNVVVVGHGRLLACKQLGYDTVPCELVDDLTEDEIKAYRLIDNELAKGEIDLDLFVDEIESIGEIDMSEFDIEIPEDIEPVKREPKEDDRDPSCQHNVFENQELMQFPLVGFYGIPEMKATKTVGDKFLRFMDWKEVDDPENYIAHFYYDDYKFISAWREPEKYLERLMQFKAVVSPDFSLYTDFPRALQILSCYRRQWCGAYWQHLGIDVIPDVVWGDKESFSFCFDGIPKKSVVAVSSVGVKRDSDWNGDNAEMFKAGYDEMLNRLQPTKILFYGDMIDGLEGDIIQIPSYYAEKRIMLNELKRKKDGQRKK